MEMARRQLIVGDEEGVKKKLRDILANRLNIRPELRGKAFSINLMDVLPYPALNDVSRESIMKILDGYDGASTVWNGVILPNYHYARSVHPHHIDVTYVERAAPAKVDIRHPAPQR
jgi:hypothetical protein